jgi:molybdopterin/thiamine biosynthesis adenylyltransferase
MSAEEFERICDEAVGISTFIGIPEETTIPSSVVAEDAINEVDVTADDDEEESIITEVDFEVPEHDEFPDDTSIIEDELAPQQQDVTIPLAQLNSNFVSDSTARFSSAEWFDIIRDTSVIIGGAGGISSWLAILLARTNVSSLCLYDNDRVETVNLAGQFFRVRDVGKHKVVAVTDILREMSDFYGCNYYKELYTPHSEISPIMMCGFDNMEARKVFFNNWKRNLPNVDKSKCLLLDGRLSAECLQVYCIQGDDEASVKYYQDYCLFSDKDADSTVCSYKQTSFMANMIAGTMVNLFVNWCANRAGGFRPVPFFTEYDAVTMQYKIKMNAI